jgi:bifunctional non-homologous end joining protein LigD
MKVATPEGLMALVQMGALEIHSWNSRTPDLDHPDQIVMDFDPGPGLSWKEVVKAAKEFRGLLEEVGLDGFVKVTGGKGLHVHVPIRPVYDWSQIKEFSRTLAREMASRNPRLYTSSMSKSERKGKIFLDYLRNERMATNVLPYSLRAREKSAVAMPLEWEELSRIRGSDAFSLEKALEKIRKRKKDPWEGYSPTQEIEILSGGSMAA